MNEVFRFVPIHSSCIPFGFHTRGSHEQIRVVVNPVISAMSQPASAVIVVTQCYDEIS
jgi:hypothetical protein